MKRRNLSRMNENEAVNAAVSGIDFTVGENVNTLRRRAGMTNATLGRMFRLSSPAMSLKLRGLRAWSARDIQAASEVFGVRMAQLQGEEPLPAPTAPGRITRMDERRKEDGPTDFTVESGRLATITPIRPLQENPLICRQEITYE